MVLAVGSITYTRPFGRIATILGGEGDFTPFYVKNQTLYGVLLIREKARLDEMTLLVERGQMKPLVEEVPPLCQVGKAHKRLESGHGRGIDRVVGGGRLRPGPAASA